MPGRKVAKRNFRRRGRMSRMRKRRTARISKVVIRSPQTPFPDRYMCKMRWSDTTYLRNNAGNQGVSWRIRTSAYDPDPVWTTGAIPGFTELAAIYGSYRVAGVHYDLELCNNEATPCQVAIVPTNFDLGANYLSASLADYPYAKTRVLSRVTGDDKCRIRGYMSSYKLVGDAQTKYDTQWTSSTNANPTFNIWFNIQCILLNSASSLVTGISQKAVYTFYVEFFDRKNLAV